MTEKNCVTCGENATTDNEMRTFDAFGGDVRYLTDVGQCTGCKKYFCDKHYVEYPWDDDTGGLGSSYFCCNCYKIRKQRGNARANWWREKVPIIGQMVAFCLEADVRVYGPGKNLQV